MKKEMLILIIISLFLLTNISSVVSIEINISNNNEDYTFHSPIRINGNDEFISANGVTGGSGTISDPYIIEGWEIKPSFLGYGIYIKNVNVYFVIKNCYIYEIVKNTGGIRFFKLQNGVIKNCYIHGTENNNGGIWFDNVKNSEVNNNVISGNSFGIGFEDVQNGVINNNIISENKLGIGFGGDVSCSYNVISNNSIFLNSQYGIIFGHTYELHVHNTITHNYIANNGWYGISSIMSYYHEITYNNISYNDVGIELDTCMCGGEYHKIHHNNFFNNVRNQVYEYESGFENYFDDGYPSGGNYWSDYIGEDNFYGPDQNLSGSDGIGDTPYAVPDGENQDKYPLMSPCQLNENIPPTQPMIAGPTNIKPEVEYNYNFTVIDSNNDDVYYYIDWGDGNITDWIGPFPWFEEVTVSHTWSEKGIYYISAKAKDVYGSESDWNYLRVTMPRDKSISSSPLLRFLERYPLLNLLFQRLTN